MATLTQLKQEQPARGRDRKHYDLLLAAWRRLRNSWPETPQEAGNGSLFHALSLAFFYKGQTDYPDLDQAEEVHALLARCAHLNPRDDAATAQLLQELDAVPGVGIPRASVILHCLYPRDFPIADVNAASALWKWYAVTKTGWPDNVPPPTAKQADMTTDVKGYLHYRRVLLALVEASKGRLTLRDVEYGLYAAGRLGKDVTGL